MCSLDYLSILQVVDLFIVRNHTLCIRLDFHLRPCLIQSPCHLSRAVTDAAAKKRVRHMCFKFFSAPKTLPFRLESLKMASKSEEGQKVDVDFESHPPIDSDLEGVATLLRQTLLNFTDCPSLAKHLIEKKDITQVIALDCPEEDDKETEGEEEEPDNDIYGVSSIISLDKDSERQVDGCKQLIKYLRNKSADFDALFDSESSKVGLIINERYINLPPQLALPTLKYLTRHIESAKYTHLVFISKVLLKSRDTEAKLPSKKSKSASSTNNSDPIIFVNPEEEIVSELADSRTDIDVSSICDENATWSFNSDIKYIPNRRVLILVCSKWTTLLEALEKELKI